MTTLSGGDKRFIEIARRWQRSGSVVRVLTTSIGAAICAREGLESTYSTCDRWAFVSSSSSISLFLRTLAACIVAVKLGPSTVVYSSSDYPTDVIPALLLRTLKKARKWVALCFYLIPPPADREGSVARNLSAYIAQRFSVSLFGFSDMVIAGTKFLGNQLTTLGVRSTRVSVVPNGVDLGEISVVSGNKYDAIFVGRFALSKGVLLAIDAWANVCRIRNDALLALVGGGERAMCERVRQTAIARGLEKNIRILGPKTNKQVGQLLGSAKMLLYMDTENGWGIAAAEAMAAGIPVIAFDLPVYREVFPGAIVLVPLRDTGAVASEVLHLLDNPQLRRELATKGRGVVRQYGWTAVFGRERDLIMTLLEAK